MWLIRYTLPDCEEGRPASGETVVKGTKDDAMSMANRLSQVLPHAEFTVFELKDKSEEPK